MSRAHKTVEKRTFEDTLRRLEQIVERLEEGNVSLEDSLAMYEEGLMLSRECIEKLNSAEAKLKVLARNALGDLELRDEDEGEENV